MQHTPTQDSKPKKPAWIPTRISHIDFTDLNDPETLSTQRALTRAELIILRVRDKGMGITEDEKKLLSLVSDEIHKLLDAHIKAKGYGR